MKIYVQYLFVQSVNFQRTLNNEITDEVRLRKSETLLHYIMKSNNKRIYVQYARS